jgi:ABC-type nitrate/sulfonate/bicarbonate transport system substrate-binding protein
MRIPRVMVSAKIVVFILTLSAFPGLSQEKVKFPVGASSKTLGYGALWIAWKQGFFDQQGLDAQVILLRGTPPTVQALVAGSVYVGGATPDAVMEVSERGVDLAMVVGAEEAGFNVIGWYRDVLPNYQLTALTVKRSWAEANRPFLIRFVKGMVLAMRWVYENKEPAIDFLAKEMKLKPAHARKGWEYYTANRIWYPDADINTEGVNTLIRIYSEQGQLKGTPPSPARYIDQSYLREALRELGSR